MSDYNIYESGNFAGYKVNESEVARLCRDVAANLGNLEYQLDNNQKHTLVWGNYCLFVSVNSRPKYDEARDPRLTITISSKVNEAADRKNWNIYTLVDDKDREPYRTQITVAIKRGPAAIAKEINTRLWSDYCRLYQMALAKYEIDKAAEEKRDELTRSLAQIVDAVPYRANEINESVNIGVGRGLGVYAEINHDSHSLKLSNVPAELMTEIFAVIANHSVESCYEKWLRKTKKDVLKEYKKRLKIIGTDQELSQLPANDYDWRGGFENRLGDHEIYLGFKESIISAESPELLAV